MSVRSQRARTLCCALALAGGAWLAHVTAPPGLQPALAATLPSPGPRAPAQLDAEAVDPLPEPPVAPAHARAEGLDGLDTLGAAYRNGMVITGSTPHRIVLFSFDDGPDPRSTPLLLDRLDAVDVKAVFFLVASRIAGATPMEREQASLAREIARRGHMIGGHTLDHAQLPQLEDAEVLHQIGSSEAIYQRVFGGRPFIFRPPFGAHSERIDQLLAERDYTVVLWNLGAGDFQVRSAEEVYQTWLKVFERRQAEGDRGGIVLLHDTYAWSVDAFQMIHAHLLARNCELLARGEELFDVVDDLRFFFVPRGDAPADALAPAALVPEPELAARQARLRERAARHCRMLAGN